LNIYIYIKPLCSRIFIFTLVIFSLTKGWSQNLVLNPSFEDHIPCPNYPFISNCNNWFCVGYGNGFNVYFNNCTPSTFQIPNIESGYQYPRTGQAMFGIVNVFAHSYQNEKTFPEDSLFISLVKGKTYHVGCYVNLGNFSTVITDDFGIFISDTLVPENSLYTNSSIYGRPMPLNKIVPQIVNQKGRMLSDTLGWILVDGIYTANGNEKFITLGSFSNDANTKFNDSITINPLVNYLYIDDVFVIPVFDSAVHIIEHDTILCTAQHLALHTNMPWSTHLQWQNGSKADSFVVNKTGTYWVRFDSASFSNTDTIHIRYDSIVNVIPKILYACAFPDTLHTPTSTYDYTWPDSSKGNSFVFKNTGTYKYSVALGQCIAYQSINVQSGQFPANILPLDTVICAFRPIKISLNNFFGSISWQDSSSDNNYIITKAGNYTLTLKNQCGTRTYTSKIVDSNCECYLYIPNAFSPNEDQHNEVFFPVSACLPENYSLNIYNRWGELIFETNDINKSWNGSNSYGWNSIYKSNHCPAGVYIYRITYKFPHDIEQEKTGTVEILK